MTEYNIPKYATRVEYQSGRKVGVYYIWRSGNFWYWHSLGNGDGRETYLEAQDAAREWIKNGGKSK